jgi:putative cardiolipin synthase
LSDEAKKLFGKILKRGVKVLISTNSLASTDNLQAFSGYKKQRHELLKMGLHIFEYKPRPKVQQQLLERYADIKSKQPVFAIHAKTMVIDSQVLYIGTYNLDPRSENLNTEVGIIVNHDALARSVEKTIAVDMRPENSWLAIDKPDKHNSPGKRIKVFFWQMMPITPLL